MQTSAGNNVSFKFRLPPAAKLSFLLFGLAGSFVLTMLPRFSTGQGTENVPPFTLFLFAGLLMIGLTAILLNRLTKNGIELSRSAMTLTLGYASAIAFVKFCLSPTGLYKVSTEGGLSVQGGISPNDPLFYIGAGLVIFLLYIFVFWKMYKHAKRRYTGDAKQISTKGVVLRIIGGILLAVCVLAAAYAGLLMFPSAAGSAFDYLGYIIGGVGIPVLLALVAAVIMARKGFAETTSLAISTGQPALIAAFFWVGLAVILLFHIMWVIFMVTLIQLWPFNTYTPK